MITLLEDYLKKMRAVEEIYQKQEAENYYNKCCDARKKLITPVELRDWGNKVTIRPDFTVMNIRTGEVYLYEHFGMMDDIDYVDKNVKKLELYEKNGYLLGNNLVITHETSESPLNIGIVESYINLYFK